VIAIAVIAAGGLAFFAYQFFFGKHEAFVPDKNEPLPVAVVSIVKKTLFRDDQLPGEIQAYQDVKVYPKVPGFIKWIGVDRGSIVKKGQLMITMYAPEYDSRRNEAAAKVAAAKAQLASGQSKLESARARWREAKAKLTGDDSTYVRLKAASLVPGVVATNDVIVLGQVVDADKQAVSTWESNIAAADHEVSALKDTVTAAQKSLDDYSDFASYLELRAPFNGYITERNMHVGSFVGPLGSGAYSEICRIQQLDLLRIVSPVPERDTAGVLPGATVEFSVSTFPDKRFKGTIARIGNYLNVSTRTEPVELSYNNPDYKILPGMFCKVYWPTRRPSPTLFVPISAVVATALETFICKVKDGKIDWVKVQKGQTMDNLVEIFGDVKEGDLVAKTGSEELQEGTAVKPIAQTPSLEPEPKRETYHMPAQ
jgi:RND family efflux transporter MFP subunit